MRRIFLGLLTIAAVALGAAYVTASFFSDTETSKDNQFTAGKLDLLIDNESYYNHVLQDGTNGTVDTTWTLDNLNDKLFFNFTDIKPGDTGEDTISLHVDDNDAWACMTITKTADDDSSCTEPEKLDDPTCGTPTPEPNADLFDGELASNLYFAFWKDDGDNVFEDNETIWKQGLASTLFDGVVWPLADANFNLWNPGNTPGPLNGGDTYYIGKIWCFGNSLTAAPVAQDGQGADSNQSPANTTGGFTCDGSLLDNRTQTDLLLGDITFSAYQHRNNPGFTCDGGVPSVTPTGVTPSPTIVSPTPLACQQADVMLVLDRSGSIDSTELTSLKNAANAFVTALGLTPAGIHAGMSSFATTGSLDVHLTSTAATLTGAINTLPSGGFTNLNSGLTLAMNEHANPGDGHDRADGTSPDKVILITDGHPNRPLPSTTADDLAAATATSYKSGGAEIFVVGVGGDVNTVYLQGIATDAGHYYSVANYAGLQTTLAALDLCD